MELFDVIVIGAGHAGCEAALVSSKMGCKTLLLTMNLDTIAQMSCNPAMGGLAKGHLVKEIDVLGGAMGFVTDQTGIQFRMLNKSKGPAVWSPRAQVDRAAYRNTMKKGLEGTKNLYVKQGIAKEIMVKDKTAKGITTYSGKQYTGKAVILCAGTFLNGLIHIGLNSFSSGRAGEPPAEYLTEQLRGLGFQSGRLKTGTPPRLDGSTIAFPRTTEQKGDNCPQPFSYRTQKINCRQMSCFVTHTNQNTHDVIRSGLGESPLYTGKIKGIGPRYCPSIEDKIVRFKDKISHQLFLEPEGMDTGEYYVNGFATSIPEQVQQQALRTVPGLENVEMVRPGYAIEYDFFPPTQLKNTLETKLISNLFFAGQINGTSGYEEAGAQGIVAGINAVLKIWDRDPFVLRRDQAYMGVLIDDLVTKGTTEPYRLFTSRAEHRLLLRQDNADIRLGKQALELGLMESEAFACIEKRCQMVQEIKSWLKEFSLEVEPVNQILESKAMRPIRQKTKAIDLLRRPGLGIAEIKVIAGPDYPERFNLDRAGFEAEIEVKYEGYILRQTYDVERTQRFEAMVLPKDFDFGCVEGLLTESRQKLMKIRPQTVGQASRISGVTPADISILISHLEAKSRQLV